MSSLKNMKILTQFFSSHVSWNLGKLFPKLLMSTIVKVNLLEFSPQKIVKFTTNFSIKAHSIKFYTKLCLHQNCYLMESIWANLQKQMHLSLSLNNLNLNQLFKESNQRQEPVDQINFLKILKRKKIRQSVLEPSLGLKHLCQEPNSLNKK